MHDAKWREYFQLVHLLCAGILFLSLCSISTNSWAFDRCNYYYEALIDADNNPGTGGTVDVEQAGGSEAIPGIDYRVKVDLNAGLAENQILDIFIATWNGSSFDVVGDPYTYNMGIMNGYQYNDEQGDVVEFFASRALLGNPQGPMKIVYHASVPGSPYNDYTAPFYYPRSTVPTLSEWGIIVLSVFLGLSAIWMIRKRKAALGVFIFVGFVLIMTGHAWAPPLPLITLDGQVTDWQSAGVSPSVIDPVNDSSLGDDGEDIVAGYITSDTNNIYFRIDIVGGDIPSCPE
jgi:hypothetical protein